MVWQDVQSLRKKSIESLVIRSTGEELCGWLLRIGTMYQSIFMYFFSVYHRVSTAVEAINNQEDKTTSFMNARQLLSQPPQYLLNGLVNKGSIVAGIGCHQGSLGYCCH